MTVVESIDNDREFVFGGELGWYSRIHEDALPVAPSSALNQDVIDTYWMSAALRVSMHAVGVSSPNPPVGCVIVKEGVCIAQGCTATYGGRHAETNALAMLAPDAAYGATAYVTLEPCSHQGKQGPCVQALIAAGIKCCVIACQDPNPLVNGKGINALKANGIEVRTGTLSEVVASFLAPFFVHVLSKRPFLALKWAQTSNNLLARDDGSSKWISNESSRAYSHWLRHRYDVIVVGPRTVLLDQPQLTVRNIEPSLIKRQPTRVILDPTGMLCEIDVSTQRRVLSNICNTAAATVYIGPAVLNIQFAFSDLTSVFVPPTWSMSQALFAEKSLLHIEDRLGRPLQSIQIEGGRSTLWHFLNSDLYDALHIFVAPQQWQGTLYKLDVLQSCLNSKLFSYNLHKDIDGDQLHEFLRLSM